MLLYPLRGKKRTRMVWSSGIMLPKQAMKHGEIGEYGTEAAEDLRETNELEGRPESSNQQESDAFFCNRTQGLSSQGDYSSFLTVTRCGGRDMSLVHLFRF